MPQESNTVRCPNCAHELDVNDILYKQLDDELRQKYEANLAQETQRFAAENKKLAAEKAELDKARESLDADIAKQVRAGVAGEREKLRETLRGEIASEQAEQLKLLNEQLEHKSQQLRELNRTRAEVEKLKREKAEAKDAAEFAAQKKLNATLVEEREKIRRLEAERTTLALSEKEIVIQQLRDQLQDASKKAEQGSTQLQGEAQELVIEDWLANAYPLDSIEEIKKGARGGDCLQVVNTQTRQDCGSIYYESKRTKHFQPAWIEKFKTDIREKGASVGVLVSDAMPVGMEHLGMIDGVWVCSFSEFKGLSQVLRTSIIDVSRAVASQENRGDKMQMLYAFLTSDEFRHQIEGIVEGFTQMQTDLESEKRAMQGIWKKREKQIQKVLLNTNNMYSSVRGIAGSAVQSVPQLELAPPDED